MAALQSVADLARLFRVTEKTIFTWIKAGMPLTSRGSSGKAAHGLSLEKCVDWYFSRNFEKLQLDRARTKLANEQAMTAALKNAATQRDLVPLSMIEKAWGSLLAELRTNALAIPTKLTPELDGQTAPERKAILDREMFNLLDRVVAWNPDNALAQDARGADEGGKGGDAAAADHGEPVGRRAKDPKPRGRGRARKVANRKG